jgi:hypothetical protein
MILNLLGKRVRQPGKAAHVHTHVEILALHVAGAEVFVVRVTDDVLARWVERALACPFHLYLLAVSAVPISAIGAGLSDRTKACLPP